VSISLPLSDLENWFSSHSDAARSAARRAGCRFEDVDDVVAEAFLRVASAVGRQDLEVDCPRSYICAVVRSVVADRQRRARVQLVSLDGIAEDRLPASHDEPWLGPSDIELAVDRLGERQRWAIRAKWVHGFSSEDVAPMIDATTARAVNQILKRARVAVKEEYLRGRS
jgi:RNA polymerase sigma factor (sigma-70 family)